MEIKMPTRVMQILGVIALLVVFIKIIVPRTSLYYRYWFFVPKFGDYLVKRDAVLVKGETFKIRLNSINERLTFDSTDYKVAYCNSLGRVSADKPGLAFIEVDTGEKVLVLRVRVLALNHSQLKLSVGEAKLLNIRGTVFHESYESDQQSVATVDSFGWVKAVGKGSCTITAKARGKTMKCKVTVY